MRFRIFLYPLLWFAVALAVHAETTTENIFLIKPDGLSYLNYHSTRSSHPEYNLYLKKEESLDKYLYINPEDFEVDKESDPERNILKFKGGNYATMREGTFEPKVSISEDGVYTYVNWLESRDGKPSNGHFGEWNTPDPFNTYVCAWVFPENIEIIDYKSNQEPDNWRRLTSNTLRWQGTNVNNIVFTITYRMKHTESEAKPEKPDVNLGGLGDNEAVEVTDDGEGMKLTLGNQSIFKEGSAELSEDGRALLGKIAENLMKNEGYRFVVEGHTDNQPITGTLLEKYGNNWGLSSQRSLAIVQFFQEAGIPGGRLEARAFGEFKPIAENTTEEGRTQNRRTEILVQPVS